MRKKIFAGVIISSALFFYFFSDEKSPQRKSLEKTEQPKQVATLVTPPPLPPIPKEFLKDRKVVDTKMVVSKKNPEKTKAMNKPNKNWKQFLKKKLSTKLTDVVIQEEGGHYIVEKDKGVFVEKVKITHGIGSFKAIVDSSNGSIIVTYDKKGKTPESDIPKINRVDLKGGNETLYFNNKIMQFYDQFKYQAYSDLEKKKYNEALKKKDL